MYSPLDPDNPNPKLEDSIMARKFFYIAAGMLMLALSHHFGFSNAQAQAPGNPLVTVDAGRAYTANGDIYGSNDGGITFIHLGNVFSGNPTPTQRETWGQVKARYAPKPGATQPQTNDR